MSCPKCGADTPAHARFCLACGAALPGESPEVRKTVTVLFSDVSGSTALGERLDPESVREVMGRFFAEARTLIERHGGIVEKFIGDAVMAVFGIPRIHEDDALRAVRAAAEIREALGRLNAEFSREFGVEVSVRTGVNTGVVVAGDPSAGQTLVTGDTVNTAARLEQAAAPGEILLGEQTYGLVREVASAEQVEPIQAKGKAAPVAAFRLIDVPAASPDRRLDSPMVGRGPELAALQQAFEHAVAERRCRLATVVGHAGIGKSRLVQELVSSLTGRARVLRGRCLSYGEGITFWPIGEIVRDAAGIVQSDAAEQALAKIADLIPGEEGRRIAVRVGALVGLGEAAGSEAEGLSAVRNLLGSIARTRPLLVLIEDVHWAEPTLLDLIEYVALGATDAPVMLLCTARPDLIERRAGWSSAVPHALSLMLEPLDAAGSQELLSNLLGRVDVAAELRDRISDAAEGNPLFVEEIFSMLIDEGLLARENGRWVLAGDLSDLRVPPTIQALLGARIDHLDPEERAVLQRASVIGKVFYWSAVAYLSPDGAGGQVGSQLLSLARKAFVLPTASDLPGEDAYRFRHILIRDAAYEGVPKGTRAELHERLARWLKERARDRLAEFEEIVGYHLERAFGYRVELGSAERWRLLGEEAAGHLAAAGRRALARHDPRAATDLLKRARSLWAADSPAHRQVGLDLASALTDASTFGPAQALLHEVAAAAAATGDKLLAAHVRLDLAAIRVSVEPEGAAENARTEADTAMPVFEEAGDHLGVAKAWQLRGESDHMLARFEAHRQALEQALVHLRHAGDRFTVSEVLGSIAHCVTLGPTPITDAIARMEAILDEAPDERELRARVRVRMGFLMAEQGRETEALDAEAEAEAIFQDLAVEFYLGSFGLMAGDLERFLGRLDRAEEMLRRSDAIYERAGERSHRSTVLATLAGVLVGQGRMRDAEETAQLALELGSSDDLGTVVTAQRALGRVLGSRGDPRAEETSRRAVALAEQTDVLWLQGKAWEDLALVLLSQGRNEKAQEALREALARFERKGATALSDRVRLHLV